MEGPVSPPGGHSLPGGQRAHEERERLGRILFFDPRLSGSKVMSCASCHNPGLAWGDGLPLGIGDGMRPLDRRTPTILNLAWAPALFWDGRAESLEGQALGPIESVREMNMKLADMVPRLQAIEGYKALFARAYPGEAISPADRRQGDRHVRTDRRFGPGTVRPLGRRRRARALAGGAARIRALQREGALQHVPHRLAVHRRRLLRHRRGRQRYRARQADAGYPARTICVQGADASQCRRAGAVPAQRLGAHARRRDRHLRSRRACPSPELVAGDQAARSDAARETGSSGIS